MIGCVGLATRLLHLDPVSACKASENKDWSCLNHQKSRINPATTFRNVFTVSRSGGITCGKASQKHSPLIVSTPSTVMLYLGPPFEEHLRPPFQDVPIFLCGTNPKGPSNGMVYPFGAQILPLVSREWRMVVIVVVIVPHSSIPH